MSVIRVWLVLLTFALVGAAGLLVCLPHSLVDEIDRDAQTHLDHSRRAASLLLRLSARKRIDTAALLASDAVLMESLDEATRGPPDLQTVHRTVQERLKAFNEKLKAELVLATDAHGRVIARVGLDSSAYKDGIEGYPLVADALRGLRGDDTWAIGGQLYRVVASPVVDRDHYAGVIVVGQEVTAELADSLKKELGVDVAFLLRGRVIASTSALPILDDLTIAATPAHTAPDAAPFAVKGYSVALGTFPGEAGDAALFALCTPRRDVATLPALVGQLAGSDPGALPLHTLAVVGAAGLGLLLFGLLLVSLFGARPAARLARDTQALSRGELSRLSDPSYRGSLRVVARSVNSTLERIGGRVRAEQRASESSAAPVQRVEVVEPVEPVAPVSNIRPVAAPRERVVEPEAVTAPLPTPAPVPVRKESPTMPMRSAMHVPQDPMLQTLDSLSDRDEELASEQRLHASMSSVMTPLPPPAPPLYTQQVETGAAALERAIAEMASRPRGFEEQTSVESPSEALLIASSNETGEEIESDFERVYKEFVRTRETCGETLEGVSFDRFVVKLRQNRSQLIQRYGCSGVKFQVYIRDGKTALKATPIT